MAQRPLQHEFSLLRSGLRLGGGKGVDRRGGVGVEWIGWSQPKASCVGHVVGFWRDGGV